MASLPANLFVKFPIDECSILNLKALLGEYFLEEDVMDNIRTEIKEIALIFSGTDFSGNKEQDAFSRIIMDYSYDHLDKMEKYGDNLELTYVQDMYYIELSGYVKNEDGNKIKLIIYERKGLSKYFVNVDGNRMREIELTKEEKTALQKVLIGQYLAIKKVKEGKYAKRCQDKTEEDTQLLREIVNNMTLGDVPITV